MPRISQFFGIEIRMYHREHQPPHFHAIYGRHEIEVGIDRMELLRGSLPDTQKRMVLKWAEAHRSELRDNWERSIQHRALARIEPWR